MQAIITDHARRRLRQRLGLKKKSIDKIAGRALADGITHDQAKGRLKEYMSQKLEVNKRASNMRVFGEWLFVFADDVLITAFVIPSDLKKYIKL